MTDRFEARRQASSIPDAVGGVVARVLAHLSLSSWVPSAVLVAGGVLLLETRNFDGSMPDALDAITRYEPGTVVLLVAAVVVTAAALQPFQFAMIRLLEGYWSPVVPVALLSGAARGAQVLRFMWLNWRFRQMSSSLYTGLEEKNRPWLRARYQAIGRRLDDMPARERILPTGLGNRLRSREDAASAILVDGFPERPAHEATIYKMIHEIFPHALPDTQTRHDLTRSQLDMYAQLVFVWILLAAISWSAFGVGDALATSLTFSAMAVVSYRAAVHVAGQYGNQLVNVAEDAVRAKPDSVLLTGAFDPHSQPEPSLS